MINDPSFCKVCAVHCDLCKYGVYSYVQNIHAAITLPDPDQLPRFIGDAAPKPFCTLTPTPTMPFLSRFTDAFKIGKPCLRITTASRGGAAVIHGVTVERSAPCGSTWYVAKKLVGNTVQRETLRDVVAKAHHSYPCTLTMGMDPELEEPLLHTAGCLIRSAVEDQLFP